MALITGGAQGIGKCTTRFLLRAGYRVSLVDNDAEAAAETARELGARRALKAMVADVADETAVRETIRNTLAAFGRLDIVVNNAGIMASKPIAQLSLQEWNRVLAVNLTGAFLMSKYAAPHLRKQGGVIVNIASTRALMSEANTEAYSASKGGLVALTHALAASLGPDIRVNCIAPGWIDVSGWKKKKNRRPEILREADHHQHPAGRVGTPDDIASLVLYLASPQASFITGACFTVDGGMTRKMIYV